MRHRVAVGVGAVAEGGAVVTLLLGSPPILVGALFIVGLALILYGITEVGREVRHWHHERPARRRFADRVIGLGERIGGGVADGPAMQPEPTPGQSKWLPDPNDFASLTLTNADLEVCLSRAIGHAKTLLGPDASANFWGISIGQGLVTVEFFAWSKVADKITTVTVSEDSAWNSAPSRNDPYWGKGQGDRVPDPPPWRRDNRWRDLIDLAWYRVRPQTDSLRVESQGESGWRVTARIYRPTSSDEVVFEHRGPDVVERVHVPGPGEAVERVVE